MILRTSGHILQGFSATLDFQEAANQLRAFILSIFKESEDKSDAFKTQIA